MGNKGRWLFFTAAPLRNIAGDIIGAVETLQDITASKQFEQSLLESEERFRTLVEESPLGISLIGKDGRYKYVNPRFERMFGYSIDEIPTGKDWFKIAFPDDALRRDAIDTWVKDRQETLIGQARPQYYPVTCKDGTRKEIHFRPKFPQCKRGSKR